MISDYDIIKKSYHREFDLITKLYLKDKFPHSLIFHATRVLGTPQKCGRLARLVQA